MNFDPIPVLNHGHVILEDYMASDLSVVNSAKVSFAQRATEMGQKEVGLLNFLMREKHGTPFEHNSFRFIIRCPLYVRSEWMRHRIASYNEESSRYSRARLDGYIPVTEDVRTQVGKPGAYRFEPVSPELASKAQEVIQTAYDVAFDTYEDLINSGVAKEVARMVLPEGRFTEFYFTINARSLMNFLSLRNSEYALREIRFYAEALETLFAQVMPYTHKAFIYNERRAP